MRTYQQIKRALANAERAVDNWYDKLDEALQNYAVRRPGNRVLTLAVAYNKDFHYESDDAPLQMSNVAAVLSKSGEAVYGWEEDAFGYTRWKRKPDTRRAIAHIARIEKKLNDWNARRFWLENALDYMSEDGTIYTSAGLDECVRELDALGHSIS